MNLPPIDDDNFDLCVTNWHDECVPRIIGSTLAEHRSMVREKLFGALGSLMSERGFDAVTLAQIAARAKVGRTSVYNHFADKEDLLLAFIEYETAHFVENLRESLQGVEDSEEQLRVYVRQQLLLQHGYQFTPGSDLRSVVSPETVLRLREHVVEISAVLRSILSNGVRDGSLPEQDLDAVVPLVHACLQGKRLAKNPAQRERDIDTVTAFVLRAVGAYSQAA